MKWENLLTAKRFEDIKKVEDRKCFDKYCKSEFEQDYQTIINSASFRRLQDKTQVFPLDKSDFVRTRLTHSLETSAIAKKIGSMVNRNILDSKNKDMDDKDIQNVERISEILACAGLLHDIGNPPFGHFGETVIGNWFETNLPKLKFKEQTIYDVNKDNNCLLEQQYADLCNFEGNAQAFRLVTKLPFVNSDYGMNLTKSVINTIIKYPVSSLKKDKTNEDIKFKKLGYFLADKVFFDDVISINGTILDDGDALRHPLTFLLEAADDIAYTIADLEDGYKKGLFSFEELLMFMKDYPGSEDDKGHRKFRKSLNILKNGYSKDKFTKSIADEKTCKLNAWLNEIRSWSMYCAAYSFKENYNSIMNGTYKKELLMETYQAPTQKAMKEFTKKYIFSNRDIVKVEISASKIITFLLDKFVNAILYYDVKVEGFSQSEEEKKLLSILPNNYVENYRLESNGKSDNDKLYLRFLLVTDYISGMTDSYAKTLYQELNGIV